MTTTTATIEGKSGKIYFSEIVKSKKEGLSKINDFLSTNDLKEPYKDYFKFSDGSVETTNEYTLDMKPIDTDNEEWRIFEAKATRNPLSTIKNN